MTIGTILTERLQQLAAETPGDSGAHTITAASGAAHATLSVADRDRYSVALLGLELQIGPRETPDTRAYLSAAAAVITRRLGFLEEPLAVWELDGREALAQLRSSPPQREGEEITYWEVTLRAGAAPLAQIARHRWAPGMAERETLTYPATFGQVARLANALSEALLVTEA